MSSTRYSRRFHETLRPARWRQSLASTTVLLVDDDEIVRHTLSKLLTHEGFEVTTAASVSQALGLISSAVYDVLLSDLHMPAAGDGLTVVSAMRHANPKAVTMLLSSFPEMAAAAHAILLQADEILVKPMELSALVKAITTRLFDGPSAPPIVETVATILERSATDCIEAWFKEVQGDDTLMKVSLTRQQRIGHLPQVFRDLIARVNSDHPLGTRGPLSAAATEHGMNRRREGYSASMLVEESRILQVCIFHTLQKNLANINFSILLGQVMTIADEVDSQLRQALDCYISEPFMDTLVA
jgi:ActR/RegA family two-component response regulator